MRIGIAIEELDPARGGAQQWTWQFARWLVEAGHEPHVVARRFGDCVAGSGVHPHLLSNANSRLGFAAAAEAELRRLRLDVTHDMGSGWHADLMQPHGGAWGAAFRQNMLLLPNWLRPLRARWGAVAPRYREFAELTRRQYAHDGRLIVALSKMVAADLIAHHGVSDSQLRLIYNGVDTERYSPQLRTEHRERIRAELNVQGREILFLIVAHNFKLKGVPTLMRAIAELAWEGQPVRLAIAGGRKLGAAARLARHLGIRRQVSLLGSVADAAPYYAAADVYVQPTFYDPCSLVVLEAWATGLPVVTSRFNGAGELMTPGVEGSLVENPADVGELLDKLRAWCDPRRRERAGHAARKLALAHGWEKNCQQLLAVYEEILASPTQVKLRAA